MSAARLAEIRAEARAASQIAVENIIRDAAAFGWGSAGEGAPLEDVRRDSVLLVHDRLTALVDELLKAGALMERAA